MEPAFALEANHRLSWQPEEEIGQAGGRAKPQAKVSIRLNDTAYRRNR